MFAIPRNGIHGFYQRFCKRPLDFVLVAATLPVTVPIIGAVTALIVLESRGPAILRVTRKGKGRSSFRQYRFRCIHLDAACRPPSAEMAQRQNLDADPRVTLMGRFLLRTRLNTLPQILNVLWGDMSIVGPRPELMVAALQDPRLGHATQTVAPGIVCVSDLPLYTDLAPCERQAIATAYSQNLSFSLDMKIMLHAARQLVFPCENET